MFLNMKSMLYSLWYQLLQFLDPFLPLTISYIIIPWIPSFQWYHYRYQQILIESLTFFCSFVLFLHVYNHAYMDIHLLFIYFTDLNKHKKLIEYHCYIWNNNISNNTAFTDRHTIQNHKHFSGMFENSSKSK